MNDIKEVYDFIKKCGTYYIATDDNGRPRVRPFGTIDLFDGRLYIQTGKIKKVTKQMLENDHIEICCMSGGVWLRLEAEAVPDERIEPQEHMLDAYPELKGMYKPGDGNNIVFYLKNCTAVFLSFSSEPKTIKF